MTIGKRLKEERKRLGKTQAGFAELGGIGLSTYKLYEGDERDPGTQFVAAIAANGADAQYIVTGIKSGGTTDPEERVLLDGFRALDKETKRRMLAFVLAGSELVTIQKGIKEKTVIASHGGQAAGRDILNKGKK